MPSLDILLGSNQVLYFVLTLWNRSFKCIRQWKWLRNHPWILFQNLFHHTAWQHVVRIKHSSGSVLIA